MTPPRRPARRSAPRRDLRPAPGRRPRRRRGPSPSGRGRHAAAQLPQDPLGPEPGREDPGLELVEGREQADHVDLGHTADGRAGRRYESAATAGTVPRMERRIFGLENEYGVTCTLRGQRRLSPDEVARYLFRRVVSWGRSSNVFLAERRPPVPRRRLAPRVRHAGVRLASTTSSCTTRPASGSSSSCWQSAEQRLRGGGHPRRHLPVQEQHRLGRQQLRLPRELPHQPARRPRPLRRGAHPVLRVSRQIYAGAGKVLQTARGADVLASPSAPSTSGRASRRPPPAAGPIINTRDEPHADAERYRRLHVIVGDSNMSEYTTFLKVGADVDPAAHARGPDVVLRDMTLENPIRAIREISHDITCRRTVRLANGREVSARSTSSASTSTGRCATPTPRASRRSSSRPWRCGSTASPTIENDPLKLDREVDWVIKYQLIEAYRAKHDLPLGHTRVALLDLQYHDVNRDAQPLLQAAGPRPGRADVHRRRHRRRPSTPRRRPPGPACAASSSAGPRSASATTPSTGCT